MANETQEIAEIIEEVVEAPLPVETVPIEELPVEAVVDVIHPLWDGYLTVLDFFLPMLLVIGGYIVLRHLIWGSLKFNYHHYLQYGEFVLCWGDDDNDHEKKERRLKIAKEHKCEADFVSWFAALLMSAVVLFLFAIIAISWPVTVILVLPLMVVRGIGYRKRKKIEFTQKLKGEHLAKEQA